MLSLVVQCTVYSRLERRTLSSVLIWFSFFVFRFSFRSQQSINDLHNFTFPSIKHQINETLSFEPKIYSEWVSTRNIHFNYSKIVCIRFEFGILKCGQRVKNTHEPSWDGNKVDRLKQYDRGIVVWLFRHSLSLWASFICHRLILICE